MKPNLLKIFIFLSLLANTVFAQQQLLTVKGIVNDKTGDAIPYVNIQVKNSIVVANTDVNGNFSLNIASLQARLIFSAIGFETQEVDVAGRNFVTITMAESFTQLEDVVVVGYGVQKKSVITGAISSIENKDFKDQPVSNLASSIQGKLAGINVTSPSGTPGAGLLVSIRGTQNPLYVVDGIPLLSESNSGVSTSYDTEGNVTGNGQNVSSVADINPNDIESMEILKDASAASIYGARAANGVVLITTKRGAQGKTQFGVNHYSGIQELAREIPFMTSTEMVALIEDARAQDLILYKKDNKVFGDDFDPSVLTNPLPASWKTAQNTNWIKEVTQKAPINSTEIYSKGGNEKTRFYMGAGYFDQKGIVIQSGFTRMNARINLDHKVNDRFSIGSNLSLTRSKNHRSFNDDTYTGIITNAIGASPLMPAYEADGSYANFRKYQAAWVSDNPVKSAKEVVAYTNSTRVLGSVFADYKLSAAWTARTVWSSDYTDLTDDQYFSPLTVDGQTANGRAIAAKYNNFTWLGENTLNYRKNILEDHNIALTLGYTLQESKSQRSAIAGNNFPNIPGKVYNALAAANVTPIPVVPATGWGLVSYIARANYDFKNRFIAAASLRVDGSSRFPVNNRYAVFPSMSLGYRLISSENARRVLTDLKLRGSYGITGDQEIGDFQNRTFWRSTRYNGVAGLAPRNIVDPNLRWQENTMFNVGIDYELFKGRVSGSLEAFQSTKNGLLSQDLVPGTTGFSTVTRNSGAVRNRGVEFSVMATPVNTGKFKWQTNFNITYLQNRVTKLSVDSQQVSAYNDLSPTHLLAVGLPVGSFWAVKYKGVDPQTGAAIYEDTNGDGKIDAADSQVIGKAAPTFYGGFNNSLFFKGFDLNIVTQFSYGNSVYNIIRQTYNTLGWADGNWDKDTKELVQVYANNSASINNRWKKPGDISNIPRASLVNPQIINNSSIFIEDASFFRIRTLALGYTFHPKSGHGFYENIRVYAQVQNPFVFTKYTGFDPEVSSTGGNNDRTAGLDYAAYPQARTYTFGINMNF